MPELAGRASAGLSVRVVLPRVNETAGVRACSVTSVGSDCLNFTVKHKYLMLKPPSIWYFVLRNRVKIETDSNF